MRKYGKVESKFWAWCKRNKVSEDGRTLALYLMTGPHTTSIGVFYLTVGYATDDLNWSQERLSEGFAELSRKGFAYRCETVDFAFIRDFLDHNRPENANVGKAMAALIEEIPRDFSYWPEFVEALKPYAKRFPDGFINRLERVSKPSRNQEPEPEPKQEPEPSVEARPSDAPTAEELNLGDEKPEKPKKLATRLPDDWTLPTDWRAWAVKRRPDVNPDLEAETFANHWRAKGGKDGAKLDWEATWHNWIIRASPTRGWSPPANGPGLNGMSPEQSERFRANVRILGPNIVPSEFTKATGKQLCDATAEEVNAFLLDIPEFLRRQSA